MEVNLNKSYCLAFSLIHQTLDLQLTYKGTQIPLCDKLKYLEVVFDHKLTWKPHVEDIFNRATKRIKALQCLAEARWGCSGGILLQTYYTFILPLLTYRCQPLVVAGKNVLHTLEKIQNQSLQCCWGSKDHPDRLHAYGDW
ncbi:hypothetical protein TNIN_53561 [Trichonephila inaurata madagascariensis]|uniref:Reverse transcriptase n=1 Tax=Trichonephila inaurata madagascariensis TaxID=2747483 RepID=A0A8X7CT18_9ARAC|nr:hypothetical protein TNIN_53561 [Trichonephila inaurata madagascariensis]